MASSDCDLCCVSIFAPSVAGMTCDFCNLYYASSKRNFSMAMERASPRSIGHRTFWPRSKCPIMLADECLKALKRIRLARADVHRTAVDTLRYRGSEPTDAYQLMFQALVGSEGRRESGTANYDFDDLEIGPKLGEGGCEAALQSIIRHHSQPVPCVSQIRCGPSRAAPADG